MHTPWKNIHPQATTHRMCSIYASEWVEPYKSYIREVSIYLYHQPIHIYIHIYMYSFFKEKPTRITLNLYMYLFSLSYSLTKIPSLSFYTSCSNKASCIFYIWTDVSMPYLYKLFGYIFVLVLTAFFVLIFSACLVQYNAALYILCTSLFLITSHLFICTLSYMCCNFLCIIII